MWRCVATHIAAENLFMTESAFSRGNGVGELYTYLPLDKKNSEILQKVPPRSFANGNYGFSVGHGAFKWEEAVGDWVAVACRIKLNDVGSENGNITLYHF